MYNRGPTYFQMQLIEIYNFGLLLLLSYCLHDYLYAVVSCFCSVI